jgi:hypothetical protein
MSNTTMSTTPTNHQKRCLQKTSPRTSSEAMNEDHTKCRRARKDQLTEHIEYLVSSNGLKNLTAQRCHHCPSAWTRG